MAEFIRFVLFSMIETIAATSIILALFRFKLIDYIWPALLINFIMSLQSFVLREEFTLSFIAPIVNLLLIAFFIRVIVKVPLIWSLFMAFCGYVVSILIQAVIVAASFGFFTVAAVSSDLDKGNLLQSITGVLVLTLSVILYKFGIGFTFEFKQFRFKWECAMIVTIILLMTISFAVLMSTREVYIDVLFLLIALLFFAYYTVRKETERHDSSPSTQNSFKH